MKWLSEQLRQEVRCVFEPRYKRPLTEDEVEELSTNLVRLLEIQLEHTKAMKMENENSKYSPQLQK